MTSHKKHPHKAAAPQTFAESTGEETGAPEPVQEMTANTAELQQALEEAKALAQQHWDRLLRREAEVQNIERRAQQSIDSAQKYALEKFATELLAVLDSLENGLNACNNISETGVQAVVEGMQLTYKLCTDIMAKFGVQKIESLNQPFNPDWHEALLMQDSPEVPENHIIGVIQQGYLLNGRLLRAARVVVSKGQNVSTT